MNNHRIFQFQTTRQRVIQAPLCEGDNLWSAASPAFEFLEVAPWHCTAGRKTHYELRPSLTLCAKNAIYATVWKKAGRNDTNSANLHNHTIHNVWLLISIVSIVCRYLFTASRTCQFAQWCRIKQMQSWAGCLLLQGEPGNRGHWLTTNPLQTTLFMDSHLILDWFDCFNWLAYSFQNNAGAAKSPGICDSKLASTGTCSMNRSANLTEKAYWSHELTMPGTQLSI